MKKYEVAAVLHPDLEIDMEAPLKRLDGMFREHEATIVRRDEWGKRKLAYAIDGQTFGVYIFYVVELAPDVVADVENSLKLNEEVIRHMVVEYDLPEEATDANTKTDSDDSNS